MSKNKKILIFSVVAIILTIVAIIIIILTGKRETYRFIEVDQYNGFVTLERNGTKPELFEGLHLITDDMVSTGDASDILLLADTDKHILAEENTGFSIKAEGNEAKGRIAVNLMYGSSLITIDNKLPDGSEFVVNTPNAALSVRGTVFHVSYDPETETTTVEVTEGVVEVVSENGTQTIEAGGMCTVSGGNYNAEESVTENITATTAGDAPESTAMPSEYDVQEIADMLALYLKGEGELNTDMLEDIVSLSLITNLQINIPGGVLGIEAAEIEIDETPDISFLQYCTNLKTLTLSRYDLEDLTPLSYLTELEYLFLHTGHNCDLSPLGNLVKLERFELYGMHSGLMEIDISSFANFKNLSTLIINNCNVYDITSLSNLTNLESLRIEYTFVSDVSPLQNLTNLKVLGLSNNEITDVSSLKYLTNLENLNLMSNKITDISELKTLKKLTVLAAMGNDIPMSVSETLQQELPNCVVGTDNIN